MTPHAADRSHAAARIAVVIVALLGSLGRPVQAADLSLPNAPPDGMFVQDYAAMLNGADVKAIGELQKTAYEQHDTPIIVVTIPSKTMYGGVDMSIEHFAYEWFNKWQIGKRGDSGELINQGVLLLISKGDRKARIELGADWSRKWDAHSAQIMKDVIVPRFKAGQFSQGIREGVSALAEMAALGPGGAPPATSTASPSASYPGSGSSHGAPTKKPAWSMTPLPVQVMWLMAGLGVVLFVAGFFVPRHGDKLMMVGIGLVIGAFFLYVLLAIFAMVFGGRGNRYLNDNGWSGGGGGFSGGGGGFSSGGFSGGGGATGGW